MAFAASNVANFGFLRGSYAIVCRLSTSISLLPSAAFTFLKNPCPALSPSHLLSSMAVSQAGILKISLASSFGQLSLTPLATFTSVSMPTTSAVRNVADFGRPITGPVSASTSSMLSCNFSMVFIMAMMPNTPTRLAINAGVSLASTVVLPKNTSP